LPGSSHLALSISIGSVVQLCRLAIGSAQERNAVVLQRQKMMASP
jgi:hypothetical protein